jgi:DNA polymerase/3'-5' exonuclease PolX
VRNTHVSGRPRRHLELISDIDMTIFNRTTHSKYLVVGVGGF